MREARERGHMVVWVTGLIDLVVAPLAERLGPDHVLANRLELRRGAASGRLEAPESSSYLGGPALRAWADAHGIDLHRSTAYGSSVEDQTLLAAVGSPCAVRPSVRLRQKASSLSWPIVER